eukprot:5814595-Amphidinium_carterae.2
MQHRRNESSSVQRTDWLAGEPVPPECRMDAARQIKDSRAMMCSKNSATRCASAIQDATHIFFPYHLASLHGGRLVLATRHSEI